MKFTITDKQKKQFAAAYLLNYMINTPKSFPVYLEGNEQDLEGLLEFMLDQGYVEIKNSEKYVPTEKGREVLVRFSKRYQDFLKNFDIFCAVDLEEGEFAFASMFDYIEDRGKWQKFLHQERWEDLRIAAALFKKLDPVEIVFMSFLNEGKYGHTKNGWEFDLLLGSVWDEIIEICNNALLVEDLGYEDDEGEVSGEEVMEDILAQGAELNRELIEKAAEYDEEDEELFDEDDYDDDADDEHYVETVVVERVGYDVYDAYYDPFYVSPVWLVPLFLL